MNQPAASPEPANDGATTAGQGTPVAVDVSTSRDTIATMAAFLAGPVLWSVHFMVVYLVVEAGCTGDGGGLDLFDPPVPTVLTLATTVVAALACVGTATWGYRRWRQRAGDGSDAGDDGDDGGDGPGAEPADRGGSLAFAGFLMSLLGAVSILLVGLPALVLPACLP
jgi:hypothetical protein